jgi:hypothetical protein
MKSKLGSIHTLVGVAAAGVMFGVGATVLAADVANKLAITRSHSDMKGFYGGSGETPEARAKAKTLGVTKYEDDAKVGGGGADQTVLVDNDVVRVNLVSFKKGFVRPGAQLRKHDQLLVYLDQGAFTIQKTGNQTPVAKPEPQRLLPGSSVFHYRDTVVSESRIDEDYRVLFIEMKK